VRVEQLGAVLAQAVEQLLLAEPLANCQYHHAYRPCLKALETHLQKKEEALVLEAQQALAAQQVVEPERVVPLQGPLFHVKECLLEFQNPQEVL
jgi:hypothetical protein